MNYTIIFNPEIYDDLKEAMNWYENRQTGLGERFYNEVNSLFDYLEDSPEKFALRYDEVHCLPVKNFPFLIHYRIDKQNRVVLVEAILNTYRNPQLWEKRRK